MSLCAGSEGGWQPTVAVQHARLAKRILNQCELLVHSSVSWQDTRRQREVDIETSRSTEMRTNATRAEKTRNAFPASLNLSIRRQK
jgi:hypothetical protein